MEAHKARKLSYTSLEDLYEATTKRINKEVHGAIKGGKTSVLINDIPEGYNYTWLISEGNLVLEASGSIIADWRS